MRKAKTEKVENIDWQKLASVFFWIVKKICALALAIPTMLAVLDLFIFGWNPNSNIFRSFFSPRMTACANPEPTLEGPNFLYQKSRIKISEPLIRKLHRRFAFPVLIELSPTNQWGYMTEYEISRQLVPPKSIYTGGSDSGFRYINFPFRFINENEIEIVTSFVSSQRLGGDECFLSLKSSLSGF